LDAALANYGGAPGTFSLSLDGRPLAASAEVQVVLSARSTTQRDISVSVVLDPAAIAPSTETLVLRVGDQRADLPFLVSFPMEFTGDVTYESRPVEGRAQIQLEVVNRSRRAVANVDVVREQGAKDLPSDRRPLGTVDPGTTRIVEFSLDSVHPLDLLGGTLEVRAAVLADGRAQGRKVARFPELATRLDDPSMIEYLVTLGGEEDPSLPDVEQARRLLMQRLRADWVVRCAEDGNAYQTDDKTGATETALGELVRAYERDRSSLSRSPAFHGLDLEIAQLADQLPGVHPNLRRWMKRLASRLDA
jgi:hypothetical protein